MSNQRGIALVIVLWGVTLLSLLAASLAASSGMAARQSLNRVEAAQARARLDEALAAAVVALERPRHRWIADGRPRHLSLDGAEADIRVTAEGGRADLNHAAPDLLQSLIRGAGGDDKLAKGLAARVAQRPLVAVAELAALPGMSLPIYRRLAPLTTVRNPDGKIDWRQADPALLGAIPGLSAGQIATLMARRGESGYSPDPAVMEIMQHVGVGSSSDQGTAKPVTLHISLTLTGGGKASADIVARLTPDAAAFHILEWRSPSGEGA